MSYSWHKSSAWLAVLAMSGVWAARSHAADPYKYNVVAVTDTAPGSFPTVRFSVTNTKTGQLTDLALDPNWATSGSGARLALHVGWDTKDFNNTNSDTNSINPVTGSLYAKGAAYPVPVNAVTNGKLALSLIHNPDGTYSATAPLRIPFTANGSGRAIMEGHPSQKDPATGLFVPIPIKSAYLSFPITDTSVVERRQVVDINNCMKCHFSGGPGGRLTLHGENRTEEIGVCVVCHNANQTDVQRRIASDVTNYPVQIGPYTFSEQSVDFKRLVHGIHASSAGFRKNPLVIIGPFLPPGVEPGLPRTPDGRFLFDASRLTPFPARLRNCLNCHIDKANKGTFELPLGPNVLASTVNTRSLLGATVPATVVDAHPANDENVTPTAAACSSCHDDEETISHMVSTGGASFRTTQGAIDSGAVRERCVDCHGPRKEKDVRRVHLKDERDDH